jgi:hypothetical protein
LRSRYICTREPPRPGDRAPNPAANFEDGSAEQGFGLIVGERNGQFIAVTAAHVLRPDHDLDPATPSLEPRRIDVGLFTAPDKPVAGRLLGAPLWALAWVAQADALLEGSRDPPRAR